MRSQAAGRGALTPLAQQCSAPGRQRHPVQQEVRCLLQGTVVCELSAAGQPACRHKHGTDGDACPHQADEGRLKESKASCASPQPRSSSRFRQRRQLPSAVSSPPRPPSQASTTAAEGPGSSQRGQMTVMPCCHPCCHCQAGTLPLPPSPSPDPQPVLLLLSRPPRPLLFTGQQQHTTLPEGRPRTEQPDQGVQSWLSPHPLSAR